MLFNKPLTEHDETWRDWAVVACLWLYSLGCLSGNALDFARFKYLRWALSGMSAISAGLGVAKVRQIDVRSPYVAQREVMRGDLFLETQAMQLQSFQPQTQLPALMPANSSDGSYLVPFNIAEFLDEVTGVAILGNSGSGKTSLAQYIAGHLPPSQVLILDPDADHDDEFYPWGELTVINDYEQIIKQMGKLLDLLEQRDKTPLVVICDEFPAVRAYAKQIGSDIPDRFILQYGSRGRKRKKFPIFLSQSGNVKSLGLDGQGDFLENFALIRLQKIARKYLKNHPDRTIHELSKAIAYPMLIGDEIVVHPTHGGYNQARKNLPPQNLKPLISLPITIPLVGDDSPILPSTTVDTPPDTDTNPTQWLEHLYRIDFQRVDTQTQGHNQALITCPECGSTDTKGNGYYKGQPRRRCKSCGKSWVME